MSEGLFERLHGGYKKRARDNVTSAPVNRLKTAFQDNFFAWLEQALLQCPEGEALAFLHFTNNLARLETQHGKVVDVYLCDADFLEDDLEPFQTRLKSKFPKFDVSCAHQYRIIGPHDDENVSRFQYTIDIDWSCDK